MTNKRCAWVNPKNELYINYHDKEWGVPVHEDSMLFQMLILEGAQAELSWETVLKKKLIIGKLLTILIRKNSRIYRN